MQDNWTQLDRAIEATEHAMFEVSRTASQFNGAKMYGLNRMWHSLNQIAGDMRQMRRSVTVGLPKAQKTL